MASQLQDTLVRIINKSNVLIEKYNALSAEKQNLALEVEKLKSDIAELRKDNEKLRAGQRIFDYGEEHRSLIRQCRFKQGCYFKVSAGH
jgi:SMC interacting uncharacterized protein involved in chromosome segregation